MKYVGWVLGFFFAVPTLQALEVQVGSSFKITGIVREQEALKLPVERDKYYNVRILNKETFDFVRTCKEPCSQSLGPVVPYMQELRPAATREKMWIASVDFNHAWLVTFLVFEKGNKQTVKAPLNFVFLEPALEMKTHELILQAVKENK